MLIISILILSLFTVYIVAHIDPIVKYINLNQLARKYTLKMERDGGLSPSEKTNLENELVTRGLKIEKATITATTNAGYGEDVTLSISYSYDYDKKNVNGLMITRETTVIPMTVVKSTVSKKGS
jgi:hypothetical protein